MRLVVLGHPRPLTANRWKDDLCEAGEVLGWQVTHMPARDIPADDVVREAKQADIFLWARTHGHWPQGDVAAMLRRIEDMGVPTVGLHLDLYWGIRRREAQIGADPWWTCQYVFTADGGPRPWGRHGVNHFWCPPPMGSRFFGRGRPAARYLCEAVFVGGCVPDIHGRHRRDLIAWARGRWRDGFAQYGGRRRQVWGAELNSLYASAQLVVGDSALADGYWSDRLVCTLGRGGLLAHPRTAGMEAQGFTDDVMVLYTRFQFDQVGERLDALTDADRRRLTDNALTLIGERHMWTNRLRDIERVVFGAGASDRGVRRQPVEVGQPPSGRAEPLGAAA